jgi:phosphate-selective porin OprO/OprP
MINRIGYWILLTLAVLVIFCACGPCEACEEDQAPPPNVELERRVRELEETVRQLKAEKTATPPAPVELPPPRELPPANGTSKSTSSSPALPIVDNTNPLAPPAGSAGPPQGGWDRNFFLQCADKSFVLRFTGQMQLDYRNFLQQPDDIDIDAFQVRRARFGVEAIVGKYYEFRLLPEWGQGRVFIQDAFMNIHYWDEFQIQAGKFKEPFSLEQLIQDRFVPFVERSLIDQVVPARDVGIMFHGQKLFDDRLEWQLGVFNGETNNGDLDTNDYKDIAGRIAVRPFGHEGCWPILRGWQFGIAGTTGIETEPILPNTLRTPASVRWFQFNPAVRADGLRERWCPEVSYFYGPFGMIAQYFHMDQEMRASVAAPGDQIVNVGFNGYFVMATYLLTGETRTTYSQAVEPLQPFDPVKHCGGLGAWELVGRVSRLHVGDEVFMPGPNRLADPARFSNGATEATLGFNWYLNRWVRMQFNWEHAWFDDPVLLSTRVAGKLKEQDTLMLRLQVIF